MSPVYLRKQMTYLTRRLAKFPLKIIISTTTTTIIIIILSIIEAHSHHSEANENVLHRSSLSWSPASYLKRHTNYMSECHIDDHHHEQQQYHTHRAFNRNNETSNDLNSRQQIARNGELSYQQQQALTTLIKFGGDSVVKSLQLYIEEFKEGFKVLMDDKSIDERLANIIYSVEMKTVVDFDFFKFNSGDSEQDELNKHLAAGPKVNDKLCRKHLEEMLSQSEELIGILERQRHNATGPLKLEPKYIHLARVLDSFGRYESGYMSGRTHSFGSYEQCLNTPLKLSSTSVGDDDDDDDDAAANDHLGNVGTRFCWARLSIDKHLNPILRSRTKTSFEPGSHVLSTAICIPESCHSRSFQGGNEQLFQRLVGMQFKLPQSIYLEDSLQVESVFCIVDEQSPLRELPTSGRLLLAFVAAWLALTVCVTYFNSNDHTNELQSSSAAAAPAAPAGGGSFRAYVECLDLKRSWLDFVCSSETKGGERKQTTRVDFNALNGVRWLGCAFVVWAHALLVRMGFSQDQLQLPQQLETETSGGMVIVSSAVVDTFFAITGILTAYIAMKRASSMKTKGNESNGVVIIKNTQTNSKQQQQQQQEEPKRNKRQTTNLVRQFFQAYGQIVLARYLRLLPLLLLVYTFKRSVLIRHLGQGPLWDFGLNRETAYGACQLQESWLVPFAFWSSFKPLSRQCLMQSWSVSCDMYSTLLLAPIVIIMSRRPKCAAFMLAGVCLLSYQWLLIAISNLDPGDGFAVKDLRAQGMGALYARISHVYTYPMYRISSFAIGIMAGYALHWYERDDSRHWPQWVTGLGTKFSLFYITCVFTLLANGSKLRHAIHPYHLLLFPTFMTLGKLLWAMSNCLVFLRMMTDWNQSFLMQASAGKFWQSLSKLNYGILLLHFDLLFLDISRPPQANLNNLYSIFQAFATVYLASSALSMLTFVVFENPMDKLVKRLLLSRPSKTKQLQNDTQIEQQKQQQQQQVTTTTKKLH